MLADIFDIAIVAVSITFGIAILIKQFVLTWDDE